MSRARLAAAALALALGCQGPTIDLGASLADTPLADAGRLDAGVRDAGSPEGGELDADERDAGRDAGRADAGCEDDDDCPNELFPHCAQALGLCMECTENEHCPNGRCEYNRTFYHCDDL